jgi:succinyl-CoA synthetase alpha subunit
MERHNMITIPQIRSQSNKILVLGNHEPIIQSILDFDYLSGQKAGSIHGIVTGRRGYAKYFWGRSEILIPTLAAAPSSSDLAALRSTSEGEIGTSPTPNLWLLNLLSGRRTLSSTLEFLVSSDLAALRSEAKERSELPNFRLAGAALFAESVPELHALDLIDTVAQWRSDTGPSPLVVGPASVGLLIPGVLKLGPIGGITPAQIIESQLTQPGHVAIMSASGGMTNELINIAVRAGHKLSFALSFGGDRFPVLSPRDAFLLAQSDDETETVLYYGELGGEDEYELVHLRQEGLFTKRVIAHIAGTVADLFPESPQFGHAKAKADKVRVTAAAKRAALQGAGFEVSSSFSEFIKLVAALGSDLKG